MAYIDNVTEILQIQPDGLPTFVRLSQNENGRNLYFQLAGNEIDIPSNSTVTISGTKPDGTVYSATGSISDNVVLIPEMIQMTAVAGTWDAKIRITSGGNTVATGRVRFIVDADTVEPGSVPSDSELEGLVAEAQQYAETARTEAYGSPLTATTVAGMTDKTRVYVYTGSETGYTAGHWYFWDGSAWTDGGVYNAAAVNTDTTLTLSGVPADAKATGDAIDSLKGDLSNFGAVNDAPATTGTSHVSTVTIVGADGKYTINGSITYNGYHNLFRSENSFPDNVSAGDEIICGIDTNGAVKLDVSYYKDGAFITTTTIDGNKFVKFKIDYSATGFLLRLRFPANSSYTNVVAYPYLLTSLSKQEIRQNFAEIAQEQQEQNTKINDLQECMPYDYESMETPTNTGIVNKWNEVAGDSGSAYAYIKQVVASGEKYEVTGYYFGENFPAYLILNGDTVMSFHNEESTGGFYNLEVTIPNGATHIVINGYPGNYPASMKKYVMVKAGTGGAKSYDSILVGIGNQYAYNDINDAVIEHGNSIISVDYGTYETEIQNLATDKKIIGKDKDLCILTGTDKDYDTPPIEIAGGIIKNFTVIMQNDDTAEHKGYCLHSDNSATANKTLLVDNCRFSCTGQHSVGIGVRSEETLIFENCYFEQLDEDSTHQPIYIHNNTGENPSIIKFHNCYFHGYGYCMKLQAWGSGNAMQFEFIGCTCLSETYGTADDCVWTDYVSGDTHDTSHMHDFLGKMTLLDTSHGNNVSALNAS